MMYRALLIVIIALFVCFAFLGGLWCFEKWESTKHKGISHPLSSYTEDPVEFGKIDFEKPFALHLGRGDGIRGLETISLNETGNFKIYRIRQQKQEETAKLSWEKAKSKIPQESIRKILTSIQKNEILRMHKQFHADIYDGTQWIFQFNQNGKSKVIYFNNHFPSGILNFANDLDQVLADINSANMIWTPLPTDRENMHDKFLWDSIRD